MQPKTPAFAKIRWCHGNASALRLKHANMRIIKMLMAFDGHPYRRLAIVCIYLPDPPM
jgi:hypothetical protein